MGLIIADLTSPYALIPLPLAGTDTTGALGLEYSLDGGDWSLVWGYSVTGGNWTGLGPRCGGGTTEHVLQVRSITVPENVSNAITFTTAAVFPDTGTDSMDPPGEPDLGLRSLSPADPSVSSTPFGTFTQAAIPYRSAMLGFAITPSMNNGMGGVAGVVLDSSLTGTGPFISGFSSSPNVSDSSGNTYTNAALFYHDNDLPAAPSVLGEQQNFTVLYVPHDVGEEAVNYSASTTVNGTQIGRNLIASANQGFFGPQQFICAFGNDLDGQFLVSPTFAYEAVDHYITADPLTGWPPSETITLTGLDNEVVLCTGMDVNIDYAISGTGTDTQLDYARVSSFTPAGTLGGTWTATIGPLSTGLHLITVRNHDIPLTESNSITLDVGGIYLGPIVGAVSGIPVPLVGIDYEDPVADAMDWQMDGVGSWTTVGSFAGASATGSPWSGTGPTALFGTHTVQVRNSAETGIVSNIQPFVVSAITLDPISAIAGVTPTMTGADIESPVAPALEYNLDSSDDWLPVVGYIQAPEPDSQWSGLGPAEPPGTYTMQVRNAEVPSVISNTVTYVITAPSAEECCVPLPSASLGRYRGNVGINWAGFVLFGDAWSGVIGVASFDTFLEYGNTMRALITSPVIHKDRRRLFMPRFELDVESGVGATECCGVDPQWMLDISRDGGRTWGQLQTFRSMGRIGEYLTRLRWLRLGQARQWILRVQSTDPVRRVIIGTYYDIYEGMSGSAP